MWYSHSTSHMISISKNEMNIKIPHCNVWHLNGIGKIVKTHLLQQLAVTTLETIVIFQVLNTVI